MRIAIIFYIICIKYVNASVHRFEAFRFFERTVCTAENIMMLCGVELQYRSSGIEAQAAQINPEITGRISEFEVIVSAGEVAHAAPLCR